MSVAPTVAMTSLGQFRETISSSFVPLDVSGDAGTSFAARVTATDADQVGFTEILANPHLVQRTPETIARGGSGYYKVTMLMSGSGLLMQEGRQLVLRPGDLSVYDTSRPYSLLFNEDFRAIVLMFSKDRLNLPVSVADQLAAVSLGSEHGLQPVVSAFLSQFPGQLFHLDERVRTRIAHNSLDLMGTMFSSMLDIEAEASDPHAVLLQRIYDFIDAHLGEPELSPRMIAEAHYISVRHLHALFSEGDRTVSTWIRERRLERCRADLLNPLYRECKVAVIAARWGFIDAANFSRAFKARYGLSPSELRNQ